MPLPFYPKGAGTQQAKTKQQLIKDKKQDQAKTKPREKFSPYDPLEGANILKDPGWTRVPLSHCMIL